MRRITFPALLLGTYGLTCLCAPPARTQTCSDEEGMVAFYKKEIPNLVGVVKKESPEQFERNYHRKRAQNYLTFCLAALNSTLECYDKAAQNPEASKDAGLKAKRDAMAKLREALQRQSENLKKADTEARAKQLVEKLTVEAPP